MGEELESRVAELMAPLDGWGFWCHSDRVYVENEGDETYTIYANYVLIGSHMGGFHYLAIRKDAVTIPHYISTQTNSAWKKAVRGISDLLKAKYV